MDKSNIQPQASMIPESNSTVDVSIIDTTTYMGNIPASYYMDPVSMYPRSSTFGGPSYSFLIIHAPSNTRMLFDLGLRIDWNTASSPAILHWIQENNVDIRVEKDVASILEDGGIEPGSIDAVIFSHHHFDHTGDPGRFSARMKVVVGPGYKKQYLPGWPEDKKGMDTTADLYRGREVVEVSFSEEEGKGCEGKSIRIGGLNACDWFGDGSFYLLDTPGHTLGHLSALARTTTAGSGLEGNKTEESTFIFLGGDVAHNCALFRPTFLCPLPELIQLSSPSGIPVECPGEVFATLHRSYNEADGVLKSRTTPFCTVTGPHHDVDATQHSIDKLSAFDGLDNIFTILAHDTGLSGVVDFFPRSAAAWKTKGWGERCRWRFLEGFRKKEVGEGVGSSRL